MPPDKIQAIQWQLNLFSIGLVAFALFTTSLVRRSVGVVVDPPAGNFGRQDGLLNYDLAGSERRTHGPGAKRAMTKNARRHASAATSVP